MKFHEINLLRTIALLAVMNGGCVMRGPVVHYSESTNKDGEKMVVPYCLYEKDFTLIGHTYNATMFGVKGSINGLYTGLTESSTNGFLTALWDCPYNGVKNFGIGLYDGVQKGFNISYPEYQALSRHNTEERNLFIQKKVEQFEHIFD